MSRERELIDLVFSTPARHVKTDEFKSAGVHYKLFYYSRLAGEKEFRRYPGLAAMRGLVLKRYPNGDRRLVAFPFAKFFNYGETSRTRTLPQGPFVVTEKLDGTLIIVWRDPDTGELHANTRGLLERSGVAPDGKIYRSNTLANPFVKRFYEAVKRAHLRDDLEALAREDRTLMFELVGEIPPAAGGDKLVFDDNAKRTPYLLAARSLRDFRLYAGVNFDPRGFPTPKRIPVRDIEDLLAEVRTREDSEGVVVRRPGRSYDPRYPRRTYLVKIKSVRYLLKLNVLPFSPRGVARLVIRGHFDDVLPYLPADLREFAHRVRDLRVEIERLRDNIISRDRDARRLRGILQQVRARRLYDMILSKSPLEISLPKKPDAILTYLNTLKKKLERVARF